MDDAFNRVRAFAAKTTHVPTSQQGWTRWKEGGDSGAAAQHGHLDVDAAAAGAGEADGARGEAERGGESAREQQDQWVEMTEPDSGKPYWFEVMSGRRSDTRPEGFSGAASPVVGAREEPEDGDEDGDADGDADGDEDGDGDEEEGAEDDDEEEPDEEAAAQAAQTAAQVVQAAAQAGAIPASVLARMPPPRQWQRTCDPLTRRPTWFCRDLNATSTVPPRPPPWRAEPNPGPPQAWYFWNPETGERAWR